MLGKKKSRKGGSRKKAGKKSGMPQMGQIPPMRAKKRGKKAGSKRGMGSGY